ncbi:hypothetical protein MKX01_033350 [Papaver californicum]|nr:hypothetical protein MKX01_033350 [Papaver californicum]
MSSNTRSSSTTTTTKQGNNMEKEKLKKLKDEPHLSGAYIRNLVKQLTSSRKEPSSSLPSSMNNKQGQDVDHVDENEQNQGTIISQNPKNQPQQQPKKQVRRRLHTSRPYQERLLNMAEARREIVTALKFHRASMKQANEQQQQQHQQQSLLQNQSTFEHEQQERNNPKYRRNPRIYPSNTTTTNTNFTNYLENSSYQSSFSCPTPCLMQPNMNHFLSSPPCIEPTLPIIDHLNLTTFPNHQPLGLNLNFHDFNNLDTTSLYYNNNNNSNSQFSSMYSYHPSPSSSSSPPPTLASTTSTTEETHSFVTSPDGVLPYSFPMTDMMIDATGDENGLHQTMDDDEMAEIRSIGEQHEMEWNDTLNLVTSAWWFKYLKKMEINNNSHDNNINEDGIMNSSSNLFDEVMEFPSWMNANNTNDGDESFFLQQHLDDSYYSDNKDYFQESALPCMDIGEIDGMDNEWLA